MTRHIALLGSTGSIGRNALEVISSAPDRFNVISLAAGANISLLEQQVRQFSPELVTVKSREDAESLRRTFPNIKVYHGNEGLMESVCHPGVNTTIVAIDGTTSLEAGLESIRRGHRICLANKETLVAAGDLINRELEAHGTELIPIDSEQSAIFQCIEGNHRAGLHRVILTASGGPFFKMSRENPEAFARITVKDALAHPTWSMGTKITIDSATLMNKSLEVIEAAYLFHLAPEQIGVVVHPQSIIHSMVEYVDASIIAQLSLPDMKIPILYSLSYPGRIHLDTGRLDLAQLGSLEFFDVDPQVFPSISMAYDVLRTKQSSGAVLNAANEVAVNHFLEEKISFEDIFSVVREIFYNETFYPLHSLDDVNRCISATKKKTFETIKRKTYSSTNITATTTPSE